MGAGTGINVGGGVGVTAGLSVGALVVSMGALVGIKVGCFVGFWVSLVGADVGIGDGVVTTTEGNGSGVIGSQLQNKVVCCTWPHSDSGINPFNPCHANCMQVPSPPDGSKT